MGRLLERQGGAVKKHKKGAKGNGIGSHHEVSPMGHATRTKTRREHKAREARKARQKGWVE
jgi:hypothetical protein